MIGRNGERRSGISAQAARHDDDDDDDFRYWPSAFKRLCLTLFQYDKFTIYILLLESFFRIILADLNYALLWMVSTRLLISKSSCPFTNPLVTVRRAPMAIDITITFMFHRIFNSLSPGNCPSFRFLSILLCGQPGQLSQQFCMFSFFLLIIISF